MASRSTTFGLLLLAVLFLASGCAAPTSTTSSVLLGAAAGSVVGSGLGCLTAYDIDRDDPTTYAIGCMGGAGIGAVIGGTAGYLLAPPPPPPPPPAPQPEKEKMALSGGGPFSGRSARSTPATQPKEKLTLRGVHFGHNQSSIRPDDEPILDEAVDTLMAHPSVTISVDGYCDDTGSAPYNQKLSQMRAEAVAKYLVSRGIEPTRVISRGFGKTHFVAPNKTEDGRAQNRRVELVPSS